jgi:hypothetical protein
MSWPARSDGKLAGEEGANEHQGFQIADLRLQIEE